LVWGKEGTAEHTNLLCRIIKDGQGTVVACRAFAYDKQGNILCASLHGNLTGNGGEHLDLFATYSADGRNLMTSETNSNYTVTYTYVPHSNRVQSKLLRTNAIHKRYFYEYDENGAITVEIIDNGATEDKNNLTGVTERHLTYTQNTLKSP